MRRLALVLVLFGSTLWGSTSKGISVAELEQRLVASHGKPDVDAAQQLSGLELTERLSETTLARLNLSSPGPKTSEGLRLLADQAAFLSLPTAEIPGLPSPVFSEQRRMMSLAVAYIGKTLHQLPNFSATRVTTQFEETPQVVEGMYTIPYRPLHAIHSAQDTVLYRDGREMVDRAKVKGQAQGPDATGLTEQGVFGPILSTVFLDAAKSNLAWGHWEQSETNARAVFRYSVPLENSHYRATYCCLSDREVPDPFDRVVAYHGEITIDPHTGSVLRITVQADLKPSDPIQRADIMVEYGPVEIGGRGYICATRSVALSVGPSPRRFSGDLQHANGNTTGPPRTRMNEVSFGSYHVFRAQSRILTAAESDGNLEQEQPSAVGLTTAATPDISPAPSSPAPVPSPASDVAVAPPGPAPVAPSAPNNPAPSDQIPVFRVATRQVVVDVTASAKDGLPLFNLGKQEFEVREDGKPQAINFFEEHTQKNVVAVAPPEMPAMPGGVVTNVPAAPLADAVNVLLIDTLNTEVQDQARVRSQVLAFLSKLPPGTRMAIFVLGSNLRCLQGFTSDTSVLLAALSDPKAGLKTQKSGSFQSRSDQAANADNLAMMQVMQTSQYALDALRSAEAGAGARDFGTRASSTFEALMYLGQFLSGVPGRKNLLWFAGSFPVSVFPTAADLARQKKGGRDAERMRITADLFTLSQVSVYPVSAEGLAVEHIGEADAAGPAAGGVGHQGSETGSIMAAYSAGAAARSGTSQAMQQLAVSTGGKAFYDTNDLGAALKRAVEAGANYYSIGYSPADKTTDGSYRQIGITLLHRKSDLAYRHGYFANDNPTSATSTQINPLAPLLRPGLPGATGILYGVRAEPAGDQPAPGAIRAGQNANLQGALTRYRVDFIIRGQDLTLEQTSEGARAGKFLLGLKAYDKDGLALNWDARMETLEVKPEQLDALRRDGIKARLDIDLPDTSDLRLVTAVYDTVGRLAGSLEVPLRATPR